MAGIIKRRSRAVVATAVLILAPGLAAAEQVCWIPYAGFEERVPHLDLETCPGDAPKPEAGFCRVAIQGSELTVYEFRHGDPGPCLVGATTYEVTAFMRRFGATHTRP